MPRVILTHDPVGTIKKYGGATVPGNYLPCDGSAVSRTTYPDLFAVIGTTYGAGDGSTTFNLPDFRGRAAMGDGTGSGLTARTVGQSVGSETHTLGGSNLPAHAHDISHNHGSYTVSGTSGTSNQSLNHSHDVGWDAISSPPYTSIYVAAAGARNSGVSTHNTDLTSHNHNFSGSTGAISISASSGNGPGTSTAVNHVNPALVVKFMIRY